MKNYLLLLVLFFSSNLYSQSEYCQFVAEISVISVEKGAFIACTKSANPAACAIAIAAHNCGQDPSCDGVVKKFVEDGCNYSVEVVGDKIKIYGKALKEKLFEIQQTYDALSSVQGLYWLQRVLSN